MKRKVKKYAGDEGSLVKGSTNLRTRSDAEFDEDSKFGGYGKYMPKTKSSSSSKEDRPTSSGVDDYATMGKRASAVSPFSGPKEYISESIKEDTNKEDTEKESPKGIASGFKSSESKFERNDNEEKIPAVKKKIVVKKKYEDTGAKIGSQGDFKIDTKQDKKIYGQGLTPYEKGKSLSDWSKMLGGGKKETDKTSSDSENLDATRRRAAGMFQKTNEGVYGMKKGGAVKKMASGGSASSRGDGIAQRGKTKGRIC